MVCRYHHQRTKDQKQRFKCRFFNLKAQGRITKRLILIYGYDAFDFNSMRNGVVMQDGHTCLTMGYLPHYKIDHIVVGQVDSQNHVLWKTNILPNINNAAVESNKN